MLEKILLQIILVIKDRKFQTKFLKIVIIYSFNFTVLSLTLNRLRENLAVAKSIPF